MSMNEKSIREIKSITELLSLNQEELNHIRKEITIMRPALQEALEGFFATTFSSPRFLAYMWSTCATDEWRAGHYFSALRAGFWAGYYWLRHRLSA